MDATLKNIFAKELKVLRGDVKETQIYLAVAQIAYHSTSHELIAKKLEVFHKGGQLEKMKKTSKDILASLNCKE